MSEYKWKMTWWHVSAILHPEYYKGDNADADPGDVPEEHWSMCSVVRDTLEEIEQQYNGLHQLIEENELIRDVKVYRRPAPVEPPWERFIL